MLAEGPFSSPSLPWRSFPCSTRARASQGRKGQAKPVGAPRGPEERPSEEKPSFPPDTYPFPLQTQGRALRGDLCRWQA